MKSLYLIDASNMFFRAFYAIRQLNNSKGLPTNALYGYLSMTVKLLKEKKPDYIAYCFDSKEPSFRAELFEDYKANRTEMPEELAQQMPYFEKLAGLLGIPCFQQSGVEADDIIGTLATIAQGHNIQVTIVSGDKDFAQLVNPHVCMYDTMKEKIFDIAGVKEKWGVRPDQIIDFLALTGDTSDNIPGIAGVGPKTALKLLEQFDSLDGIYKNVEAVKPDKLREKVKASKEIVYLSKKLVTIKTDLELNVQVEDLKLKPIPRAELSNLLLELDFKTFERKIFDTKESSEASASDGNLNSENKSLNQSKTEASSKALKSSNSIENSTDQNMNLSQSTLSSQSEHQSSMSFEYESKDEVLIKSPEELLTYFKLEQNVWVLNDNRGFYLSDSEKIYSLTGDLKSYSETLNNLKLKWQGFYLKSTYKLLNLSKPNSIWDSQIAAYVLNASAIGDFQSLFTEYCKKSLSDFPTSSELLNAHKELQNILMEKLKETDSLKIYNEFDLPLIEVLYEMESLGIKLDSDVLKEQSISLNHDIKELEKNIYDLSGDTFNIASPKQLAHVLFEKLKLTPIKKTKTGFSTDSDVLEKLENEHPVARLVIEYRELSKLKSTYVDSLPLLVDPKDGRIHTEFNQAVTTTGRLSSTHPNLQNIPIRTERGNAIRKAFVSEKGSELISADYSQIELRVLAHVTSDSGLVKAFENDLDIHAATASEVFGIALKEVTSDQRRIAKAVNFGLAYGMGPHGLADNLKISRTEASEIIKKYFMKFPGVKNYMQETVEKAKQNGFVETIFGRRRYTPELQSKNAAVRSFGERAAINAPMQGTASDIVKKAMIEIYKNSNIRMLLQVHDELIFEVPKTQVENEILKLKNIMETVVKLKVPLKVNISHGSSWYEAHS